MLLQGKQYKEIAAEISRSLSTVKYTVQQLYRKLAIKKMARGNAAEKIAQALLLGTAQEKK